MAASEKTPSHSSPIQVLRERLAAAGVKRKFLNNVVLPEWWEDDIGDTRAGMLEAAGYVCARLGFDLSALLDASAPLTYARAGAVKYKKAAGVTEGEVELVTHYAVGVARALASGMNAPAAQPVPDARTLRQSLLAGRSKNSCLHLRDLIDAAWALGIPVIHLRNFPKSAKKPDALTTWVGDRPVIVLMSGRKSPSWMAFILAHELGHIHRGHIGPGDTLVDDDIGSGSTGTEEVEANDFAMELLVGNLTLKMMSPFPLKTKVLLERAKKFKGIAPGVIALNYGFNTGHWGTANGAVTEVEADEDAADDLQGAFERHVKPDAFSEDTWDWIKRAISPAE